MDGKEYQLDINNGPNALHGGLQGFDKKIWTATVVSEEPASVRFELVSPDGDQGYPGTLTTQVTYTVTDKDELVLEYHATTDQDTIVNLTNHSYFNLAGVELNPKILDHRVTMTDEVKAVLECDTNCLPTGKVLSWSEAPWMNFSVKQKTIQKKKLIVLFRDKMQVYLLAQGLSIFKILEAMIILM